MQKNEGSVQKKIIKRLEAKGWYVVKNIKCNKNGFPDLSAFKSGYPPFFVEVKTKTGKLSPLQKYRIKEMRKNGLKVRIWNQ